MLVYFFIYPTDSTVLDILMPLSQEKKNVLEEMPQLCWGWDCGISTLHGGLHLKSKQLKCSVFAHVCGMLASVCGVFACVCGCAFPCKVCFLNCRKQCAFCHDGGITAARIYIYILLHLYEPNTPPLAYVYINMESGHGHGRPTFGRSGSSGVLPASRLSWAATMSSPRWGSPV